MIVKINSNELPKMFFNAGGEMAASSVALQAMNEFMPSVEIQFFGGKVENTESAKFAERAFIAACAALDAMVLRNNVSELIALGRSVALSAMHDLVRAPLTALEQAIAVEPKSTTDSEHKMQ